MRLSTSAVILAATATSVGAQKCAPLEFLFARGTTEPPVNVTVDTTAAQFEAAAENFWSKGYGAAGNSVLTNLTELMREASGYPVHYPANSQFNTSSPAGVKDMVAHLEKVSAACPKTVFALGGHSQGAAVTVGAIPKLSKNILSKVIAITMFGGRDCPAEVKDRCRSYCNAGDTVCDPQAKSAKEANPNAALPKGPFGPAADILGVPKNGMPPSGKPPGSASPASDSGPGAPPAVIPPINPPVDGAPAPPKSAPPPNKAPTEPKAAVPPSSVPSPAPPPVAPPQDGPPPVASPLIAPPPVGPKMPKTGVLKRQARTLTCSGPEVAEKGHVPVVAKGESAHTIYNKDGYYVQAAACYIYNKWKARSGTSDGEGKIV